MSGAILDQEFYRRTPLAVARDLIGKELVRRLLDPPRSIIGGIIVETEAYGAAGDQASHAFRGRTPRNSVMFGDPGKAYVYFTYGNHYCLNFVTGRFKHEDAGAVLIRALEPTSGIRTMMNLRKTQEITDLTSGPGKLCKALSIDLRLNGIDVTAEGSELYVRSNEQWAGKVASSTRIGIRVATEKRWRFFAELNSHVSNRKLIYRRKRIA